MKPIAHVNKVLKQLGREERLVHCSACGSCYYMTGSKVKAGFSSSLHIRSLEDTREDHLIAKQYVESVLSEIDGERFVLELIVPIERKATLALQAIIPDIEDEDFANWYCAASGVIYSDAMEFLLSFFFEDEEAGTYMGDKHFYAVLGITAGEYRTLSAYYF